MLRTFDPFREFTTAPASGVDYDLVRAEDSIELRVDIPGINPDDVDITVDGRTLRLEANREVSANEGTELVSRRRRPTHLRHTFQLGDELDTDRLAADYEFGVLKVTIPVAESAKPRKVLVGSGSPAIDAADASA